MIEFVYFDDWCAVYKDGLKIHEDHTIDAQTLLNILNIPAGSRYLSEKAWVMDGYIPDDLSALPVGQS